MRDISIAMIMAAPKCKTFSSAMQTSKRTSRSASKGRDALCLEWPAPERDKFDHPENANRGRSA